MKNQYNKEDVVPYMLMPDQYIPYTAIALDNGFTFTEIVNAYFSKLLLVAFRITKSRQTSEDIVQEAFLKLWQNRAAIMPGNPGGWLYTVVTNSAYKHLKKESRKIQLLDFLKEGKQEMYTEVEERLMNKETETFFYKTFKKLPARQQLVYQLSQKKGLSRDEIASHLNISPNTVKVHLLRAFQFIKEHMASACLFLIFFVFNNLFFRDSNTITRSRDLYNVEHAMKKKLSEEMIHQFSYSRLVAVEKNQSR